MILSLVFASLELLEGYQTVTEKKIELKKKIDIL